MSEKMHWMPFNINDWLSSGTVQAMPFRRQGIYLAMLARCWSFASCSLVADPEMILDQLPGKKESDDLDEVRIILKTCFVPHPELPDRLINEVQYSLFLKQSSKLRKARENGSKGGKTKASKASNSLELRSSIASDSVSNSLLKKKEELSDAEEVPRWAGCEHFRMDSKGYQKVLKAYAAQGLTPTDVGIAIAEVDRWLDSEDAKPRKARARKTSHHRFLNATWVLDNLARRKKALAAQAAPLPSRRPELRSVNGHEKKLLKTVGLGG